MRRSGFALLPFLSLFLASCGGGGTTDPKPVTTLQASPLKLIMSEAQLSQTFTLSTSPAGSRVDWHVKGKPYWLTLTPDHGTLNGTMQVTATAAPLPTDEPGNHADVLELAAGDSGPVLDVAVQVFLLFAPHLVYSPASLAIPAGSDTGRVTMTNDGRGNVSWRASSSVPWLHVVESAGFVGTKQSVVLEVVADRTSLPSGTSSGSISVLSGADAVPTGIAVTVTTP